MSVLHLNSMVIGSVLVLSAALIPATVVAESAEQVDYLSLTALMIKDGDYIRAGEAIAKVDHDNEKFDKKRFFTLRGIINLNKELYAQSITEFESAITAGQENKVIYVYLAQAYMGLEKYDESLIQLEKVGDLEKTMPGVWLLRSQAYWLSKKTYKAWNVLGVAQALFPEEKIFIRNKIFYAIELGLFQEAVELGQGYIKNHDASVSDYVSLGDALRQSGKPEVGLSFLELAKLNFPGEKNVYVAMAHAYLDMGEIHAAAMILEEGGVFHNELLKDSAELYKKANVYQRALFNNSKILKQKDKLQQRMALYLEIGSYDQVLAMQDELRRVRLLDEQDFLYAIA